MGIEDFAKEINKAEKKKMIRRGTEIPNVPRFSTGSLSLDAECGSNEQGEAGFPVGKVISLTGEESSGKTAVAMKAAAEFQKKYPDQGIFWCDAEASFQPEWARALGLDPDEVFTMIPEFSEQAFNAVLKAVQHNIGLIVIDSLGALSPKDEMEADMESFTVGLQARLNRKMLRKFSGGTANVDFEIPSTLIYINHLNVKMGGGGKPGMVSYEEPGGRALKYWPGIKIIIKKGDQYPASKTLADEGVEPKAQEMKFHIIKNKTAPPFRRGHFWFYFDTLDQYRTKGSYDKLEELVRYGTKYDLIQNPSKGYYTIVDPDTGEVSEKFHGSGKMAAHIRDNQRLFENLEQAVIKIVRGEMIESGKPLSTDEELEEGRGVEEEGTESSERVGSIETASIGSDTVGEGRPKKRTISVSA